MSGAGTIGRISRVPKNIKLGVFNQALIRLKLNNELTDPEFFFHWMKSDRLQRKLTQANPASAMANLVPMSEIKKWDVIVPEFEEQSKLGGFISRLDAIITLEQEKNDHIKLIKKSILQNIFTEKEKGFTSLRFNSFNENWVERKLGDLLKYEQPTKYIVKTAEYSDKYDIPVLTAGKTFLLGYTNETTGIYDKGEVILFDDFTTATQFVDFKFKVKSSAMKLLTPVDNNDINFLFEVLNVIQYPHEDHKRYWISEFSTLKIMVPKSKKEQQQIGSLLKQIDIIMKKNQSKINMYLKIKASLLDTLFV